jgi:hypothetical protein
MDMLPDTGFNHLLKGGGGEMGHQKIMHYITIMDSMTDQGIIVIIELLKSSDSFFFNVSLAFICDIFGITLSYLLTFLEKDMPKVLNQQRIIRIARGSGRSIREVQELLAQHKQFEKVVEKMKGNFLIINYFFFLFSNTFYGSLIFYLSMNIAHLERSRSSFSKLNSLFVILLFFIFSNE